MDRKIRFFMKSKTTRPFTIRGKVRKGAEILPTKTFHPFRADAEHRLKWLLGFAQESAVLRSPADRRRIQVELRAYLGDLHIRRAGEKNGGQPADDPWTSEAFPMMGRNKQKYFKDQLERIRTDVRRIV